MLQQCILSYFAFVANLYLCINRSTGRKAPTLQLPVKLRVLHKPLADCCRPTEYKQIRSILDIVTE